MRNSRFSPIATVVLALVATALPAAAATETVLYSFKHPCCGYPEGRLYGVGSHIFGTGDGDGKSGDYGQVFELTNSGGSWTETSPLIFNNTDGATPTAGLIRDSFGHLYGTTAYGDAYNGGNVFILYKSGSSWVHGTIWAFGGTSGDGATPICDLIMDSSGNLYGTTYEGGAYGNGTVFEIAGGFTATVLYSFKGGSDGAYPQAGLLMDSSGGLYGTTAPSGGGGTVFKLTQSGGVWSESVLHSFGSGSDGDYPTGVLVKDAKGALYSTTQYGGTYGTGTVFKLFQSGGVWNEKVLYNFNGGSEGQLPMAGLRFSGTSALYGTTYYGGQYSKGVVFKLTESGGVWSETVLHSFGNGSDGADPFDQVILDKSGNLYGTTEYGGTYGRGTVWEVTP